MSSNPLQYRGMSLGQLLGTLAAAFTSVFPQGISFVVAGVTYTGAQIAALFLQMKVLFDQADEARMQYMKTVAARDATLDDVRELVSGVAAMLETMYRKDPASFAKFGVPAKKEPRPLSAKEKVAATTKAKATRNLRGTKGKRELEKVKAEGTPVVTAEMPDASTAPANGATNGVVQTNKVVA